MRKILIPLIFIGVGLNAYQFRPDNGRFLGAQCAQCHGTNGYSFTKWDSIAGEGEFHKKSFRKYPIMRAIALGYSYREKITIDNWLNTLPENKYYKKYEKEKYKYKKKYYDEDEYKNEHEDD